MATMRGRIRSSSLAVRLRHKHCAMRHEAWKISQFHCTRVLRLKLYRTVFKPSMAATCPAVLGRHQSRSEWRTGCVPYFPADVCWKSRRVMQGRPAPTEQEPGDASGILDTPSGASWSGGVDSRRHCARRPSMQLKCKPLYVRHADWQCMMFFSSSAHQ